MESVNGIQILLDVVYVHFIILSKHMNAFLPVSCLINIEGQFLRQSAKFSFRINIYLVLSLILSFLSMIILTF